MPRQKSSGGVAKGSRKRAKRRPGRKLKANRKTLQKTRAALGAVRAAKAVAGYGAAWRELHGVESRLSRLV